MFLLNIRKITFKLSLIAALWGSGFISQTHDAKLHKTHARFHSTIKPLQCFKFVKVSSFMALDR